MRKAFFIFFISFLPIFSFSQIITTIAGNGVAGYNGDNILATSAELNGPNSLTIDRNNNILFCDAYNNRIRKIDAYGTITTIAGNGFQDFYGDSGMATSAALNGPVSVLADSQEYVYISTNIDSRIRKI